MSTVEVELALLREYIPEILRAMCQVDKLIFELDDAMPGGISQACQKIMREWAASARKFTVTQGEIEGCADSVAARRKRERYALARDNATEWVREFNKVTGRNHACGGGHYHD